MSGCAQEVYFSGERTPRLDQAGWLRAAQTGRSIKFKNKFLLSNLVDHPVRSGQGSFAAFSLVAATPPDPGGECPRLRITRNLKGGSHRGFTLIEVLVAMTILAMAFSVLFSLSSRSLDGMRRARDIERRVQFARTKLAELRMVPVDAGDRAEGTLDDGTRWSVEVTPFIKPVVEGPRRNPNSVVRIRLSLEWQGRYELQKWAVDSYRFIKPGVATSLIPLEEKLHAIARK
jgi:prepilin-type N-terminal cleavage/methylation domain-containing protein